MSVDLSQLSLDELGQVAQRITEVKSEGHEERVAEFKKSKDYKHLLNRRDAVVVKGQKLDGTELFPTLKKKTEKIEEEVNSVNEDIALDANALEFSEVFCE